MNVISKIIKSAIWVIAIPFGGFCQYVATVNGTFGDNLVKVEPVNDNVIKVSFARYGHPTYGSQAVLPQQGANATVYGNLNPNIPNEILVTSSGIVATLNKATGDVVISAGEDKIVSSNLPTTDVNGNRQITVHTMGQASWYGAGERGHSVNLRGDTLVMYNRQNYGYGKGDPRISQMNITMPLVISSDGYALLFDDFDAATLALEQNGNVTYTTENQNTLSYYFIAGDSTIADVVKQTSALTGRQPLPPLWSLGYITSKYGYQNEKETLGAIDSLKTRGYPVDGIVLDLYWYGKEQDMGALAWAPEQWPDPEKMLKKLRDENVNLIAISQPYVLRNGRGIDNYDYLAQNGMLALDSLRQGPQEITIWVGEGGMIDVSNPKTQQWLANTYKELTDMGVAGWWGDLGEPEVHPESTQHYNGLSARQYHNQYGNDWSKVIAKMFADNYPDRRLVTMMRGGTTGLQRYSVFPWSTDVARSWEGLQPQITIMLNSGLSGLGYMGHDVGGFAVDKENPEDPELYVRWLQLGTFSPMLRTHAQYKAEPYHYPQYHDITLHLIRERYRWLPYNYTLAYENAAFGYPLVRPLNFYEAGSNAYDSIDDEYLWGSEVLVAPVLTQGATSRRVIFPKGEWVDFNNPMHRYHGGDTIEYDAPIDVLPIFVRAGAFIPLADYDMQSTAEYDASRLTIEYYPSASNSSYVMYDDDKVSQSAIANGKFRLIEFKGDCSGDGNIEITVDSQGDYPGAPDKVKMRFSINGQEQAPRSVMVDGHKTKYKFIDGSVLVDATFTPGKTLSITIVKQTPNT